jgi:hypothetical protein
LCTLLQINQSFTTVFHPQSDGLCERFNRTMFQMLAACGLETKDEWDNLLPYITLAYNSSEHSSTLASPFELIYGREVSLPVDLVANRQVDPDVLDQFDPTVVRQRLVLARKVAVENIVKAQLKQTKQYNKKSVHIQCETGNKIWFLNTSRPKGVKGKLSPRWIGPFIVIGHESNVNYRIRPLHVNGLERVVHVNLLSKRVENNEAISDFKSKTDKNKFPVFQSKFSPGDLVIVKP